jgi:translation initiation factor 2B subunit (eIF-2B alpha/beta/delta family)
VELPQELREALGDRRLGASEIEQRLLQGLIGRLDPEGGGDGTGEGIEDLLTALTAEIRERQPAMANLLQLANRAWLLWERRAGTPEVARRLARQWRDRLDRLRHAEEALGRHLVAWAEERWGSPGRQRPDERVTVLTLSRSGTVRAGLTALREAGWDPVVRVGEGRPGNEGRDQARDLRDPDGGRGIDARLVTDAAVVALAAGSSWVESGAPDAEPADPARTAVVVGADAVGPEAFLNKVGTRALAAAAGERGVPVLVVADAAKVLPEELFASLEPPAAPAAELDPPAGVPALNVYFEVIPLRLVTRVVSEDGVVEPAEVRRAASGPVSRRML